MKSYRRQTRWVSRSCIKNTAHVRYSVRENSTSWRKFDGSADTWLSQAEFRVSCRVPTASPPRWRSTKPAIVRVFYPGTDTLGPRHTPPDTRLALARVSPPAPGAPSAPVGTHTSNPGNPPQI